MDPGAQWSLAQAGSCIPTGTLVRMSCSSWLGEPGLEPGSGPVWGSLADMRLGQRGHVGAEEAVSVVPISLDSVPQSLLLVADMDVRNGTRNGIRVQGDWEPPSPMCPGKLCMGSGLCSRGRGKAYRRQEGETDDLTGLM